MLKKFDLYINTIKYLKPIQVIARVNNCLKKNTKYNNFINEEVFIPQIFIKELDEDKQYLERFCVEDIMKNRITLLHETHMLDLKKWTIEEETRHLWLFNLQYMEYLIPLAISYCKTNDNCYYEKIREYLLSWIQCFKEPTGDAWAAYTISLRIPNLLIILNILKDKIEMDKKFFWSIAESLYKQYEHLKRHTELHLLGNHYLENLKCLLICSIVFQEADNERKYQILFLKELSKQVLPDGMHYERSFMYHKIILEDLLRVYTVIEIRSQNTSFMKYLQSIIRKMCKVEEEFELGLSRTLLFNDAGNNISKFTDSILKAALNKKLYEPSKSQMRLSLPDAGYFKYEMRSNNKELWKIADFIIDCGNIGPNYIPGHGQCDCLSYEFFVDGYPVLVNSGTYQYQDKLRAYFRSTRAHNTFCIDNYEQSQCWGEHRVARRITKVQAKCEENHFVGTFRDYKGKIGQRRVNITNSKIIVNDKCLNNRNSLLTSWIHIPCNWNIAEGQNLFELSNTNSKYLVKIMLKQGTAQLFKLSSEFPYGQDFGKVERSSVVKITGKIVTYYIEIKEKRQND